MYTADKIYIRISRYDRINKISGTGNCVCVCDQARLFGEESDLAQNAQGYLYLCLRNGTLSLDMKVHPPYI